jgi:hypothetical protein
VAESRVRRLLADGRFLFAVMGAAALLAFLGPLAAYDLWWHLKAGRAIIQSGSVPHTDVYSFTAAGRPWTFHSWLAGVALAEVWAAAGATGVVLFRAIMMTASVMVAWALARRRGVGAGLATVLALPACLQLKVLALASSPTSSTRRRRRQRRKAGGRALGATSGARAGGWRCWRR